VEKISLFTVALNQNARILHHLDKPPVDPELGVVKEETVRELRVILRATHNHLTSARRSLSLAEQFTHFRDAIMEGDAPHLQANLESWTYFFTHAPGDQKAEIKDMLAAKRAADLYNAWIASSTGYTRETLRQKISSLTPRP
jgi:hypothetical protein